MTRIISHFRDLVDYTSMKLKISGSLVMDGPTKDELEHLCPGDLFNINIGTTICSEKDQFSRKLGRDLATTRMSPTAYKLYLIEHYEDGIHYYFDSVEDVVIANSLHFSTKAHSSRVLFIK